MVNEGEVKSETEVRAATPSPKRHRSHQEMTSGEEVPVSMGEFQKPVDSLAGLTKLVTQSTAAKVDEESICIKLNASMPDSSVMTGKRSCSPKGSRDMGKMRKGTAVDTLG